MYFPCSSRTVAVTFTNSTFTFSRYLGSCGSAGGAGGVGGGAFSCAGVCVCVAFCCATIPTALPHKTPKRPRATIQTCFFGFMSHHLRLCCRCFILCQMSRAFSASFYTGLGGEYPMIFSVPFSDDVAIPVRY